MPKARLARAIRLWYSPQVFDEGLNLMLATDDLLRESALPGRLGELLPRYLTEVPLYRSASAHAAAFSGYTAVENLRLLPFITKKDIRTGFPRNLLRAGVELEQLLDDDLIELEHTSGTSEERTPLLLGKGWWAEQEARALRLNPVAAAVLDAAPSARRVTISSPVCSSDVCFTGVPSRAERIVDQTLFLSLSKLPFLWGENDLSRMAREAAEWEPKFLDVDPVYGVVFALYCERRGIKLPSLRFIICSYEFVSLNHRRILERVFGVPVLNLYGSTETGHLLMETPNREMAPSLETAFLEVLGVEGSPAGELCVTTLTNDFMPLIRYRIGDLVEKREYPYCTRYVVHGRKMDAFTAQGRSLVTPLQIDRCFDNLEGIAHYQLSERSPGDYLLRFVPDRQGPVKATLDELRRRLGLLFHHKPKIVLEQTDLLMPENSGKFRLCYPAAL